MRRPLRQRRHQHLARTLRATPFTDTPRKPISARLGTAPPGLAPRTRTRQGSLVTRRPGPGPGAGASVEERARQSTSSASTPGPGRGPLARIPGGACRRLPNDRRVLLRSALTSPTHRRSCPNHMGRSASSVQPCGGGRPGSGQRLTSRPGLGRLTTPLRTRPRIARAAARGAEQHRARCDDRVIRRDLPRMIKIITTAGPRPRRSAARSSAGSKAGRRAAVTRGRSGPSGRIR